MANQGFGAYGEFADDPTYSDGLELARNAANVMVTHTFSKLGLASARVGWGYAPAEVIAAMELIRQPFNLTIAGMEATAAIARPAPRTAPGTAQPPPRDRARHRTPRWRHWRLRATPAVRT